MSGALLEILGPYDDDDGPVLTEGLPRPAGLTASGARGVRRSRMPPEETMMIFQTRKSCDPCAPDEHVVLRDPASVEVHLSGNPQFTRRYGAKVKEVGGTYTMCRGYPKRLVTLPLRDDTRAMINAMVHAYGEARTVMIARGTRIYGIPSWVVMHYISPKNEDPCSMFLGYYWQAVQQAVDRKLCNLHEGEPPVADPLVCAQRRWERARADVEQAKEALRVAEAKATEAENAVRHLEG